MEKSKINLPSWDESNKSCLEGLSALLKKHGVPAPISRSVLSLYSEIRSKSVICFHLLGAFPEVQDFICNDPILH